MLMLKSAIFVRTTALIAALGAGVTLAACSGNMTGAATPPISQQGVSSGGSTYAQGAMGPGGTLPAPTPTASALATSEAVIDIKPTPIALPILNGVSGTLQFLPKAAAQPTASGAPSATPGAGPSSSPASGAPRTSTAKPTSIPTGAGTATPSASSTAAAAGGASAAPTDSSTAAATASAQPSAKASSPAAAPHAAKAESVVATTAEGVPTEASEPLEHQAIAQFTLRLMPTDAPTRESKTKVLATQPVAAIDVTLSEGDALLAGMHGVKLTMPENAFTGTVHTAVAIYELNTGKKKKKSPQLLALDEKAGFVKGILQGTAVTPIRLRAEHTYEIVVFADQALIVNPLGTATPAGGVPAPFSSAGPGASLTSPSP